MTLKERSASQSHFIDLCRLTGQPTPTEADPTGDFYTFERGAEKTAGPTGSGHGWADVWKKGYFAWEYKGPKANLEKAYQQLQQYRESLENPPLLVVSDLQTIEVHTNFTNSVKRVSTFTLDDLLDPEGASGTELRKRTLTNLYNARPTWLENVHKSLDEAVFAAYGWPSDLSDEEVLQNLLTLNLERPDLR